MNFLQDTYYQNPGLWNVVMGLLVFGGLGRIAFWRKEDGMRVGGPLAVGLALLLTIAIIVWAHEKGHTIQEFGPWAAGLVWGAIITLGISAFRKAGRE
jgi:hypothetical protein